MPSNPLDPLFGAALGEIEPALVRSPRPPFEGVDFTGNDYLGLGTSSIAVSGYASATGSRLLSGDHMDLHTLERSLAAMHQVESALAFPSAYQANLALMQSLVKTGAVVLVDKHVHASVLDGLRLAGGAFDRFRHNDLDHLQHVFEKHSGRDMFVVTESVFSIWGDEAPLTELAEWCAARKIGLIVDEAHACGWAHESGGGKVEALGLGEAVTARILGFGKAWGAMGGAILSSSLHRQWMWNVSRPLIYSTALSPAWCRVLTERLGVIQTAQMQRELLSQNLALFSGQSSPIHFIETNTNSAAIEASEQLEAQGIRALSIRIPTAPENRPGIRINVCSHHSPQQVTQLKRALDLCLPAWNS